MDKSTRSRSFLAAVALLGSALSAQPLRAQFVARGIPKVVPAFAALPSGPAVTLGAAPALVSNSLISAPSVSLSAPAAPLTTPDEAQRRLVIWGARVPARLEAIRELGQRGDDEDLRVLAVAATESRDHRVRHAAVLAIASVRTAKAVELLSRVTADLTRERPNEARERAEEKGRLQLLVAEERIRLAPPR